MKKIIIYGILLFVVIIILILIFLISNYYSMPPAPKIDYPSFTSVDMFSVYKDNHTVELSQADKEKVYGYICDGDETRISSLYEVPQVSDFYVVRIKSESSFFDRTGYIYKKWWKVYFEIPYMGIYVLDSDVMEYIEK